MCPLCFLEEAGVIRLFLTKQSSNTANRLPSSIPLREEPHWECMALCVGGPHWWPLLYSVCPKTVSNRGKPEFSMQLKIYSWTHNKYSALRYTCRRNVHKSDCCFKGRKPRIHYKEITCQYQWSNDSQIVFMEAFLEKRSDYKYYFVTFTLKYCTLFFLSAFSFS